MRATQLETLAKIRAAVGYLGERDHFAWWQSAFFSAASRTFLAPIFAKTQLLAQVTGVTQAAARIHDERIGVGQVYHLFRLPEPTEQAIHRLLMDAKLSAEITFLTNDKDVALQFLRQHAEPAPVTGMGPTRLGNATDLAKPKTWRSVVNHYLHGFEQSAQIFPYFVEVP
ncbi:MAG: BrxE family protein [Chloroflexi bacterium]|nr:MAG: BrxE family protein [Chloroflexota bacterium]